ncbi:hypothetical protein ACFIQF_09410 [Comamonas sp. J-3]
MPNASAPPLNFIARQSVWALAHGKPLLFLPRAAQNLQALLGLDYSPSSIQRIQAWLSKQRRLRLAAQRPVFDEQKDVDTLMLLSFYVAEWIARTSHGIPRWTQIEGGAAVVNFPEDRHCSFGMLALPGVVQHAWVQESADLLGSLSTLINIKVLEQPDQALPAAPADRDSAYRQRWAALPAQRHGEVLNALPSRPVQPQMQSYFAQQQGILQAGYFVCGAVIQANRLLYEPQYVGLSLAEVVFDPNNYLSYADLAFVAQRLLQLKSLPEGGDWPAEVQAIGHYLRQEDVRKLSEDVPEQLFGYPLKLSSMWVEQAHLPDGMLSYTGVPLVIAPNISRHVKLLPCALWSPEFVEVWRDASEKRLGQRYDVADLQRQAQQTAREQAVQLLLQEAPSAAATKPVPRTAPAVPRQKARRVEESRADEPSGSSGLSLKFVLICMAAMLAAMLLLRLLS